MARKTFYLDKLGIRVEGQRNATEARRAWEAARDRWCDVSTACPPWVFAWRGHVAIVQPTVHDGWSYQIVAPDHTGRVTPHCFYSAASQIAAIAVCLGALAQYVWSRDVADDAAFFDELLIAARVTAHEARDQRSNFLHVTNFWRQHPIAA